MLSVKGQLVNNDTDGADRIWENRNGTKPFATMATDPDNTISRYSTKPIIPLVYVFFEGRKPKKKKM